MFFIRSWLLLSVLASTAVAAELSLNRDIRPGLSDNYFFYRERTRTKWKRNEPHTGMQLFDAPFRETCALRRARSNTRLQALNLLNDPTYVEAARFLTQRMTKEGYSTAESRLTHSFRRLLHEARARRSSKSSPPPSHEPSATSPKTQKPLRTSHHWRS